MVKYIVIFNEFVKKVKNAYGRENLREISYNYCMIFLVSYQNYKKSKGVKDMQKKIRCVFITILAILAVMVMASSRSEATTVKVSPSKTMYTINGNTRMYRYKESSGTYNNIYCLDYCGTLNSGSYYTISSDIYNLTNNQIIELFGSVENYNKALWVMDNMFLSEDQNSDEMITMIDQLKQVLHTDIAKNAIKEKYNLSNFSNESMDTAINHVYQNKWYNVFYSVQQCVLWNYTTNTKSFPGLTKLYGGYSLEGKYYNWMYTGLKAVADTKGNYSSPNKSSNGVSSMLNSLTMSSSNAKVDLQNKKIGPFVINGYDKEVITKKNYEVKINGTKLATSDYTITFDGTNIYIKITNSGIDLSNVKVDISVNLIGVETKGNIFYKQRSQDIVYLKKNTVSRKLNGTTEDTEFDLRLLKNIEAVWSVDNETSTEKYNIDKQDDILKTRKLQRMSTLNKGNTTEIWYTNKYPVNVATGDIVKYAITISNEGSLDGYATKVTDYIADGLELVSKDNLVKLGILNNNDEYYGWTKGNSENGFTEISTTYLSDKQIKAYNKESDTLDTKVIYIYCKVTSSKTGALLKNIAEITADKTTNISGQDVDDRDSTPGSLKMTDLSNNWKGNKGNPNIESTDINKKYTYAGNEDDDDFETVKVQNFDMTLTKQITSVKYADNSSINLDRLIDINKSDLNNANASKTTASYNMNKSIVNVTNNSIITYRIYVYNEGDINGYAKKITDYLPKGLEFYSGDVNGVNYNWSVASGDNGTTIISTDYLANTCIYAYKNNTLSSAYVEVQCKVTSNNVDEILTNVAEITDYGYYINNTYVQNQKESKLDRDSVQDSVKENASTNEISNMIKSYENNVKGLNKDLEYIDKNDTDYEDDDDFEWVKISNKELDLALRKSISAVNGNAIVNGYNLTENRLPKVNSASVAAALSTGNAEYYHNKEYITVNVDDEITYTIRVYNEGSADDYYGYAKTITDYLPNGLTFVQIDNSSTANWTTTSKQGDSKVVLEYTGNKTLMSDSLSKIAENNNNSDLYQTVSIVCKVNNVTGYLTNKAEITSEVATDENGNIVEGIKDRDSTPGSLTSDILKLETYYKDYNRKYGINDTYIDYYPGEENGKKEDDIDFETVYVEEIEKVEISGTKTWNDNGNQDGKRPEKIRVYLLADGDVIANKVISEAEGWKYSFTNLDKYKNGKEIVYSVDESQINEYTKTVEGYNLINTHNPEKVEVNGTKTWNDNGNKEGKRPEKLTVYLLADGVRVDSKEVSEATGWKYSFTNLDKYKNGKEIVYTIDESEIEHYTKTIDGYNLTNTYNPEKVEVNGIKTWNDNGNKEGKRPEKLTVYLLADGVKVDSKEISEAIEWKYSFTGLDKYKDGKEIVYTIDESEIENYTKTIEGYNLINTYDDDNPEKVEVSGTKTWNDNGNKDGKRPEKLTVYLLADGVKVDSKEISEAIEWKYSFTGLDKYKDGKEIVYTIDESEIENYTKTIEGYNLINTYNDDNPEKVEVSGTKTWNDNGNKDGKRPEKLTVYLLADGVRVDSKEISEATGWKYSFTNLDKYKDGKEIVYTIDESEIENYTKKIEGYNLINTYDEGNPEKVEIGGIKTWNDNDNKNGKRPKSIIVNLLADGVKIDSTIVVEGTDGTWKYSFTNLDKQKDGKDIVYTITEEPVEYYESKIEGYNITNKYNEDEPEKISISGQKTWKDENNKDQIRPKVLRVYLLADGVRVDSVLVTSANNWKYSFENLDKTKNGKEIKYTIDEENISGYEKTIDGYNLINTHIVKPTVDFSLRKFITDVNEVNVEPSRAPQVDITPLVNGTSTTATYTHPKNAILVNTGDVITYTLRVYNEGEISGYASLIKDDIPDGLEFIPNNNTNKQYLWEMLDANGNKVTDVTKAKYVVSNYLSKEVSEDNLIKAFDKNTSKELDYKEVKVSFKVISTDTTGKELINYAQISKETDSEGNDVKDRDSTPDKWIDGEDDQDIEKVKLTYLDLSLRKFITKIDNNEVTPSRAPEVDVSKLKDGSSTTATYNHPKDVVNVSKDNIVVYTLRIYNEGSKAGCATLVKDDIPTGLQYLPSNEINKKYNWKMLDESGNETTDASKAKYVVTDYLANDVIKAFDPETMETLDYRDVQVAFKVIAPETSKDIITNYAQISEEKDSNGNDVKDRDSTPDKWIDGEDDQDTEKIKLTYADLSLRKFITEVNNSAVNPSRAPEVDVTPLVNETGTTAIYNHPKDPVNVQENDIVTYTLRIYNEGTKSVYASLVKDDIPDGLEFIVDNEINKKYNWKMLDESGNEVTDVTKAKYIVTDYLANDIIKAFDPTTMKTLDYKDVKVSFKVKATTEKDKIITNYAQISKEKDSNGNDVKDRDSTPDKWVDGEDDQDTEKIKVKYFDLALQKWVSKVIVIEDGKEKVTKTGYSGEQGSEPVVKVDLKKSKISNVIVKFEYQIRVTNEGQIPGYATEVSDYIPNGLKFNKEDNVNWVESGDKVTTNALENTLLQPGESATVSIVLTWINGSNNLGLKTNIAEISEDADKDKKDITDIDSTPDNKKDGEDDIDDAPVILTIKTGETPMYIGLTIGIISILGVGIYSIKKYILK